MRIALISEHASPLACIGGVDAGGQNVYVSHVARCLAAAGHLVDVLTRRDSRLQPAVEPLVPGVRVLNLNAGPATAVRKESLLQHMPEFTESADRVLRQGRPYDVMHAHFFMSGWVGLALRQRRGVPLVTSFHALGLVRREHHGDSDDFPAERIDIERALAQQSDRVIAACPQDESDLLRLYGADPARLTSVPCGVDMAAMRPGDRRQARQRLGLPQDEFIVLQLGRLVPRKGIDNVVRALALMRRGAAGMRPARLVVVGGGSARPDEQLTPEIGRLRRLATELGVGRRVNFAGCAEHEQLRDWYVAADVFVTTPWYEPFGITPLEAMACGTAVIGSAVGGIKHTVQHGVTGWLVPPHDPAALAARLDQLRADPALGTAMGTAGVRRVRAHFTWDQVAERLASVYAMVRRTPLDDRAAVRTGVAPQPLSVGLGALQ
jgi:glycosyltransferase involved in cell wall biosynthesis